MSKLILPNVNRHARLKGSGAALAATAVPNGWGWGGKPWMSQLTS